ncbi:MAG: TrkA C-terminal domain-containing protein [Acidimicrobiales bacterium]
MLLREHTPASEALRALSEAHLPGAPVVNADGSYLGTADVDAIASLASQGPDLSVAHVLDDTTTTVALGATLDVGLEALTQAGGRWVAVTNKNRRVVGILAISDLVRAYRQALDANVGEISQVTAHAVAIEERVGPRSELIGQPLRTAPLPPGCVVITVKRGDELLFATGATTLAEGDVVSALTSLQSADAARQLLCGATEPGQGQAETNQPIPGAPTSGAPAPRPAP